MNLADKCICCSGTNLACYYATLAPFIAYRIFGREDVMPCNSLLCNDCGCLFQAQRYTEAEMHKLYDDYRGAEYLATRERYEPGHTRVDAYFSRVVPYMDQIENLFTPFLTFPVSILDWGGDDGHNAPFAQEERLLHVYDIGNKPVIAGALKVSDKIARFTKYDLIVCANLLEHVPYPAETLNVIKKSMDKHSVLYLELPYEPVMTRIKEFRQKRGEGQIWHEHINAFSTHAIDALLERCGLYQVTTHDEAVAYIDCYASIQLLLACKLI
jgi:hypothetical protein